MQYAMLIGPFEDNIQMDQSASLKTWVSIAAAILLMQYALNNSKLGVLESLAKNTIAAKDEE